MSTSKMYHEKLNIFVDLIKMLASKDPPGINDLESLICKMMDELKAIGVQRGFSKDIREKVLSNK